MKLVWIIARQELRMQFDSLMAYILLVLFLGFSGIFTWLYGSDIFIYGQASLQVFFSTAYITLFLLIPALTMNLLTTNPRIRTLPITMNPLTTVRRIRTPNKSMTFMSLLVIEQAHSF